MLLQKLSKVYLCLTNSQVNYVYQMGKYSQLCKHQEELVDCMFLLNWVNGLVDLVLVEWIIQSQFGQFEMEMKLYLMTRSDVNHSSCSRRFLSSGSACGADSKATLTASSLFLICEIQATNTFHNQVKLCTYSCFIVIQTFFLFFCPCQVTFHSLLLSLKHYPNPPLGSTILG